MTKFFLLGLFALVTSAAEPAFTGPVEAGELAAPPKRETSGLAISRRDAGVLWTHDDSGGAAALYAVKTTGEKVGVLRIQGAKNEDWEDLASYELHGKPWLLIADTGDNDAKRASVRLHLIEEPLLADFKAAGELSARPTRTIQLRYEDGPRDCEGVAVDVAGRAVYLLTKREEVKRLYRIELEPKDASAVMVARHVALVSKLPQPTAGQRSLKSYLGRRRAEVTAMDFTADGKLAVVLTYGDLWMFVRRGSESWHETFARAPVQLPWHGLIQAEAACFSADGRRIYVAAEDDRTLMRYDRK